MCAWSRERLSSILGVETSVLKDPVVSNSRKGLMIREKTHAVGARPER